MRPVVSLEFNLWRNGHDHVIARGNPIFTIFREFWNSSAREIDQELKKLPKPIKRIRQLEFATDLHY